MQEYRNKDQSLQECRETLHHKKRAGAVYGTVPLRVDRVGDRLVPNAAEQRVIARIRRVRAAGDSCRPLREGWTVTACRPKPANLGIASTVKAILDNDLHETETERQPAAQ